MAVYTPTVWEDEIPGETPVKYVITGDNDDCTIELKTAPTAGTPVNASNLNHIENGLVAIEERTKIYASRRVGAVGDDWGGTNNGTNSIDISDDEQLIQIGASIISDSGDLTVTFPVAFVGVPVILVQIAKAASGWPGVPLASYITNSTMHLSIWSANGIRGSGWVNWLAIGPA
jgi:hypothetical protein